MLASEGFFVQEVLMNTLIVYTTKYGATAECAAKLKKLLHGGVVLADLKGGKAPDLSKFDRVIVGGPAYVGRVGKEVLAFCNTNMQAFVVEANRPIHMQHPKGRLG